MRIPIDNNLAWYDRIWAALIFFTRLPFWRIHQPKKEAYETVVEHWPLTGWLTGGIMALTLYLAGTYVNFPFGIIAAITVRILLTGALHEDGLADFFDGFGGGGHDRERILTIMKDSHIGTYGVLGLILYTTILHQALYALNSPTTAALTILIADPFCKTLAGQLILWLPYARSAEDSKNGVVYRRFGIRAGISLALQGLLPVGLLMLLAYYGPLQPLLQGEHIAFYYESFAFAGLCFFALYSLLLRRIHGYTGDCCGAVFLLTELCFYITTALYYSLRFTTT